MYVVKRADNIHSYGNGKNNWKVIHTSKHKDAAVAFYKQEYRMLLESDPNLSRQDIDNRMNWCYNTYNTRCEASHNGIGLSILHSNAVEYQEPVERPDRTELLDSILN